MLMEPGRLMTGPAQILLVPINIVIEIGYVNYYIFGMNLLLRLDPTLICVCHCGFLMLWGGCMQN